VKIPKLRWRKWITFKQMRVFPIKISVSRLFSLVGALILFTTFLVKEELKDHEKDLLSEIETAKARYVDDQRTNSIINLVEDLEYIRRTEGVGERRYDPHSAAQAKLRLVSDYRTLSEYGAAYSAAETLKPALPDDRQINDAEKNVEGLSPQSCTRRNEDRNARRPLAR
jgi:hypothetical protein